MDEVILIETEFLFIFKIFYRKTKMPLCQNNLISKTIHLRTVSLKHIIIYLLGKCAKEEARHLELIFLYQSTRSQFHNPEYFPVRRYHYNSIIPSISVCYTFS